MGQTAKRRCEAAPDCHALSRQTNICGGRYRVTHGGPTLVLYPNWQRYGMWSYTVTRPCAQPTFTWSARLNGRYVREQHGATNECYDFQTAKRRCEAAPDCSSIARQTSVCGGRYRVTHMGPTLVPYQNWQPHGIWSYRLTRNCAQGV